MVDGKRLTAAVAAAVVMLCIRTAQGDAIVRSCFDASCQHWNDTDGNRIEAHAAGMLQNPSDNRWYWFGESKKTDDLSTHGVTCYSSLQLGGPWKFEGMVFKQEDVQVPGQQGPWVIERPKVLYNPKTKKFVMWFHLDSAGYKFRHAAVAIADTAVGPYKWVHAFQPDGIPSLDMSLFEDPIDHQAYFVRSCDNKYAGISRLTPDYLNTTGIISTHTVFEGMALMRLSNGTYYIVTSHLTGWNPNPLMMFRAAGKTLDDPQWVSLGNPTGDDHSFNSQPTYVVSLRANNSEYFVYMADNWVHGGPNGLIDAAYIWLPFWFSEDGITLKKQTAWSMDNPFVPPPPPPPCHAYNNVALQACAATNASKKVWSMDTSKPSAIILKSTGQCLTAGSDNKVSLATCASSNSGMRQQQQWQFTNGRVTLVGTNQCLDVTWCGNDVCPGQLLEVYTCHSDPQHNELFQWNSADSTLISDVGQQCVTSVCSDSN